MAEIYTYQISDINAAYTKTRKSTSIVCKHIGLVRKIDRSALFSVASRVHGVAQNDGMIPELYE